MIVFNHYGLVGWVLDIPNLSLCTIFVRLSLIANFILLFSKISYILYSPVYCSSNLLFDDSFNNYTYWSSLNGCEFVFRSKYRLDLIFARFRFSRTVAWASNICLNNAVAYSGYDSLSLSSGIQYTASGYSRRSAEH